MVSDDLEPVEIPARKPPTWWDFEVTLGGMLVSLGFALISGMILAILTK